MTFPTVHLTLTGFDAGKPLCGIDKRQAASDGHTFLHAPYYEWEQSKPYMQAVCPDCRRIYIDAVSDESDDCELVLEYESRIAEEFGLTIDDVNSEGTLFTGEPGKIAHFVYVGLGATIHPRNPDEDWANVTSDGVHIGQIDYNLPRGRVGFSALNTPILPLLKRLFPSI